MKAPVFPRRAAAALFLERQHLQRPRARRFSAPALLHFVEDVGGVQIDSINVVDRAHYLTIWSRFGAYDRAKLDRLVYRKRILFEYWAHAACLVPTNHFPWWRRAMLDYHLKSRGWRDWLRKNKKQLVLVEAAIREKGPQGTADFAHRPGSTTGWWNWKPAAFALDYLWMSGRTLVHSRKSFQKRYDFAEKLMPEALGAAVPDAQAFSRWHIERSLHAMGAATEIDLRSYMTFPKMERGKRRKVLDAMVNDGSVREIVIEGERAPWFCLTRDLDALAAAGRRRTPARGTTFLAPFDSFLWHRDRVARLFHFDYRIEVYVPAPKRVHGYYVLPVLHDGHLVGRVDVKTHREHERLELKRIHLESWVVNGGMSPVAGRANVEHDGVIEGIGEAARDLARFVGARRITIGRVTPARMTRAMRAAVGA